MLFILVSVILNIIDNLIPKKSNYWIFPVYNFGNKLGDNSTTVYNYIKNDENIIKIILVKRNTDLKNLTISNTTKIIRIDSLKAIKYFFVSKIIILQHSIFLDFKDFFYDIQPKNNRNYINLWHGITIKDISNPINGISNIISEKEMKNYYLISSSEKDKENMKKAFYKTKRDNIWITGLPKFDILKISDNELPSYYYILKTKLDDTVKNKKLILYAPTYRDQLEGEYYAFNKNELERLKKILDKNNAIIGFRYHPYNKPDFIDSIIDNKYFYDFSSEIFSDINILIKKSTLVISDYSSIILECLYINKRILGFTYDIDIYGKMKKFMYNFREIFPGNISVDFKDLELNIAKYILQPELSYEEKDKYLQISEVFFKYIDSNNAKRVVEKVKQLD